ncbi:MAG: hypothetical protein WCK49_03965 [Myxococcaceae bacterium]
MTGEISGDQLASDLISRIRQVRPEIEIQGVCGPGMRGLGVKQVLKMETFQTFFPVSILLAPWFSMNINHIKQAILELNPKVCVFVDASFLSFTLASRLRKAGFKGKIIKMVCPATWWPDHGRKQKLEKLFDVLISIFPHEVAFFQNSPLAVHYFEHPLFQKEKSQTSSQLILALFPGSRPIELRFGIHKLLKACVLYQQRHPEVLIQVSCAALELKTLIKKAITRFPKANIKIETNTAMLLERAKIALAKPGTINLELAQYQIPTLIAYPLYHWTRWLMLGRLKLVRPHHAMINFVYEDEVFPELLLNELFTPEKAAYALENLDASKIRTACQSLIQKLKNPDPDQSAANLVLHSMNMLTP